MLGKIYIHLLNFIHMRRIVYLTFLVVSLLVISNLKIYANPSPGLANPSTQQAQHWIDSVMNNLSLREKIAQLFMVAAYSNRGEDHIREISQLVKEEKVGGLCFFQGGPVRQAQQTNKYQSLAKVPLLVSMDAEWGLGMRLDSTISYPRQMMLGAIDDNRLVYHMGADIARQLNRLGVHINFAPVVDINNNPANPVINVRAFGEDKELVTQKGLAYMLGLQDNGVLACAKHFPGHGDTDTDSHYALPLLKQSFSRIDTLELYPFRRLIENGVASVMVGHMEIPALEPKSKLASSLSPSIVNSLLINNLGYNGLIITDALNMKGVSDFHKPVNLNYLSLIAGNDIILFPSKVKESIDKIEEEVLKGRFPIEEIERRCRKVIEAKYRVGLNTYKPVKIKDLVSDLNRASSNFLIRQITEQAITVLNNSNNIIPLRDLDKLRIAYIEIGDGRGTDFREQMEVYAPITTFPLYPNASEGELNQIRESISNYNLIVVGYHTLNSRPNRDFGVTPQMAKFLNEISLNKKMILSLFGTPYALDKLHGNNEFDGLIIAYDNESITQNLTAQLIFGGYEVSGRLPVSTTNGYAFGAGSNTGERIRLRYSVPEELNIKTSILNKIDSIALDAIARGAAPGMQILAAKDGVVFYSKSFGGFTYADPDLLVDNISIYDIASVTKIAATLPVVMDLYSKGIVKLDDNLGKFLTLADSSKLNNVKINDILLHQAGLAAWIPFYQRTLSSLWRNQPVINGKFSNEYPYQIGPNRFLSKHASPSRSFYRNSYSSEFPNEVAKSLYSASWVNDSIFHWIMRAKVDPPGKYRYSDLGFILIQKAMEKTIGVSHQDYLNTNFYNSLGMNHTLFNPLTRFDQDRIVPTENDVVFRKQLIWGHVHDPAAAMMGGVAGHAGLFSTANDMAKLLQMYLNKGEYGGVRYFPATTVEYFTSCVNCVNGIRRGLGFDKPEPNPTKPSPVSKKATSLSYGHSGFTGTLVWVDPVYGLVYVFISNRVFPDADNRKLTSLDVRTKVQDVLYEAVEKAEGF
jgi:beta-N-acetylhexosaminidase